MVSQGFLEGLGTRWLFWMADPTSELLSEAWGPELGSTGPGLGYPWPRPRGLWPGPSMQGRGVPQPCTCSLQPATAVAACVTSSRASASAHRAHSCPSASSASPRPSAATLWWAVKSVTARGPVSRSSRIPPVTQTAASASESPERLPPHPGGGPEVWVALWALSPHSAHVTPRVQQRPPCSSGAQGAHMLSLQPEGPSWREAQSAPYHPLWQVQTQCHRAPL